MARELWEAVLDSLLESGRCMQQDGTVVYDGAYIADFSTPLEFRHELVVHLFVPFNGLFRSLEFLL